MKRLLFASVLAASTLWLHAPVRGAVPPPLPKPAASLTSGSIRADVYGTPGKPPLIFIPGLMCGPWEWAREIADLAPNYTIYALTLPGFDGQAPVQADPFQTVSADFWTLLETQKIEKPIVIGHSLGGTLGIMLAEQHADRLRALVAVDGMPIFPGMQLMAADQRTAAAQRMSSLLASIDTPAQFEMAEKTYSLPYLITSKSDIDAIAPLVARSDPKATAQWVQSDMLLDLRPQLPRVTIAMLEIAPFDPQFDPAGPAKLGSAAAKQAYYASLLPGAAHAKVEVVEPSRHFIMYDRPQQLHDLLTAFLASVR